MGVCVCVCVCKCIKVCVIWGMEYDLEYIADTFKIYIVFISRKVNLTNEIEYRYYLYHVTCFFS